MSDVYDFDYWTGEPKDGTAGTPTGLHVEIIGPFEPLDDQLGVERPKTVPEALAGPLFDEPRLADMGIQVRGQDGVPPLRTYAILDAAKVAGLPELLVVSGLEHHCLFKGDAFDDLGDVAPWIVRLDKDNTFTRCLFTRGEAPWHLWDTEAGIYFQSRATLNELRAHFRKFTRVQNEHGKWFYWRFWEPQHIAHTLEALSIQECSKFFMAGRVERILAFRQSGDGVVLKITNDPG